MIATTLVGRAIRFATLRHGGQTRKYDGTAYTLHLHRVADLVAGVHFANPEVAIASAYLHDVVEDTNTDIEEVLSLFGARVALIVNALTDKLTPKDGNREFRKNVYREQLVSQPIVYRRYIQTIKIADLIDNSESVIAHDPKFATVFMKEFRSMMAGPWLNEADICLRLQAWKVIDRMIGVGDNRNKVKT